MFGRVRKAAKLIEGLPPGVAAEVYESLMAAEAKLTDAMDQCDASAAEETADVLQFVRDDIRAMRRAANDARLK
jgi:hypothetical protein